MVYSKKGNLASLLFNYKISNPCQHFLIGGVLQNHFKSKDCLVSKVNYMLLYTVKLNE
jgi:hypothetical protein